MALEQVSAEVWEMSPGPFDGHTHPRALDPINKDDFLDLNGGFEGKSGVAEYTKVAFLSGITGMLAMPNEQARVLDDTSEERTELRAYPIANIDRVTAMQGAISSQAHIPTGIHMGLDPVKAFHDEAKQRLNRPYLSKTFAEVSDECTSLKIYLAETTGGNNVAVEHATGVMEIWARTNPDKTVVLHVEGEDVAKVFDDLSAGKWGKEMPVHIAHISSRQELEAVMQAKREGMNVTCEVTPHHLSFNESLRKQIGGYGCMKPSLKPEEDRRFIIANLDQIDMFASDCAPHRRSDKEGENPAFGVVNHTVMLPLLMGMVEDGRLTMKELYDKMCVAPRRRFNIPDDDSHIRYSTAGEYPAASYDENTRVGYGFNPYAHERLAEKVKLVGWVLEAQAGNSYLDTQEDIEYLATSYTHLIRPKNFGKGTL